ncbi:hypothetical protein GEMRC1_003491 [Eukaryota sp. GEM-RC1]
MVMKLIRVVLEGYSTVLFLPLILHFSVLLKCSDATRFWRVSLDRCHIPSSIIFRLLGILTLLFSVCVKFIHSLSQFHHSPSQRTFFGRPHSRWLTLFNLLRLLLVFSLTVLDHLPLVFEVSYVIIAITSLVTFLFMHPFFVMKANSRVAGFLGTWALTSCVWLLKEVSDRYYPLSLSGLHISLIFNSSMVLGFIIFYLTSHFLQRRSLTTLIRLNSKCLDENSDAINDQDIVLPRVRSHYKAELLSRSLLTSRVPPVALELIVKAMFENLTESNPDIPEYLISRTYFELIHLKSPLTALVTLNSISTLDVDISLFDEYLIFALKQEVEKMRRAQNTGHSIDAGSFVILQRQLSEAKDLYKDSLDHLRAFWSHLLSENVNLQALPALTQRIFTTRTQCNESFKKLLNSGKGNIEILSAYMDFVRDVLQDDELLQHLQTQYDLLQSDSANNSSNDGKSSRNMSEAGSTAGRSFTSGAVRRRKRKGKTIDLSGALTQSSGAESSINSLNQSILTAFVVVLVLSVISYYAWSSAMDEVEISTLQFFESGHLGYLVNRIGLFSLLRDAVIHPLESVGIPEFSVDILTSSIIDDARHLLFHVRRLYLGSETVTGDTYLCTGVDQDTFVSPMVNSPLQDVFVGESIPMFEATMTIPSLSSSKVVSFWDVVLSYSQMATTLNNDVMESGLTGHTVSSRFIQDNQFSLYDGVYRLWHSLESHNSSFINQMTGVGIFVACLNVFLLFCLGYFLFRKAFQRISAERNYILNLFLYIPKPAIVKVLSEEKFSKKSKVFNAASYSDSDSSDGEDDSHVEQRQIETSTSKVSDLVYNLDEETASEQRENPGWSRRVIQSILIVIVFVVIGSSISFFALYSSLGDVSELNLDSIEILALVQNLNILQRDTCYLPLHYAQFSDIQSFDDYWKIIGSGKRNVLVSKLTEFIDDSNLIDMLGQNNYYNDLLFYYERVALYLATIANGVDLSRFDQLSSFEYDLESESRYHHNLVRYPNAQMMYNNSNFDQHLPPDQQRLIARDLMSNEIYVDYRHKALGALQNLDRDFSSYVSDTINSANVQALSTLRSNLIIPVFVVVSLVALLLFSFKKVGDI